MTTKEELIKKANTEAELYDHYLKIMDGMVKWCIFKQPDEIKVFATAFGISTKELTLKAMREVLEKYEGDEKRGQ